LPHQHRPYLLLYISHHSLTKTQASVAKGPAGQLQVRLANSTDYPPGCQYQITLIRPVGATAVQLSDIPHGIGITTTAQSPLARCVRAWLPLLASCLLLGACESS
jgi:hypothetical protein